MNVLNRSTTREEAVTTSKGFNLALVSYKQEIPSFRRSYNHRDELSTTFFLMNLLEVLY